MKTKLITHININSKLIGFKSINEQLKRKEGLKIAAIINDKGLTPYRIKVNTGIQENQLNEILNGTSSYTIDTLNKLKIYLGIITDSDIKDAEMYLENYKLK